MILLLSVPPILQLVLLFVILIVLYGFFTGFLLYLYSTLAYFCCF